MKHIRAQSVISRLCRTIAYMAVTFDWLLIVALALPALLKEGALDVLIKQSDTPAASAQQPVEMNPFIWILVAIVTIVMIVVSIYALFRVPRAITKQSDKLLEQTARTVVPVITHHHRLPEKQKRVLQNRTIFALQIIVTLMPFVGSLFVPVSEDLQRDVIVVLAAILSLIALVLFALSWAIHPKKATSRTRSHVSHESR